MQLCAQQRTVKVTPPFTSLPEHRFHIQTVRVSDSMQLLPTDMMPTYNSTTMQYHTTAQVVEQARIEKIEFRHLSSVSTQIVSGKQKPVQKLFQESC